MQAQGRQQQQGTRNKRKPMPQKKQQRRSKEGTTPCPRAPAYRGSEGGRRRCRCLEPRRTRHRPAGCALARSGRTCSSLRVAGSHSRCTAGTRLASRAPRASAAAKRATHGATPHAERMQGRKNRAPTRTCACRTHPPCGGATVRRFPPSAGRCPCTQGAKSPPQTGSVLPKSSCPRTGTPARMQTACTLHGRPRRAAFPRGWSAPARR